MSTSSDVIQAWNRPQDPAAIVLRWMDFTLPLAGDSISQVVSLTEDTGSVAITNTVIGPNAAGLVGQIVQAKFGPTVLPPAFPSRSYVITAKVLTTTRAETLLLSGLLTITKT